MTCVEAVQVLISLIPKFEGHGIYTRLWEGYSSLDLECNNIYLLIQYVEGSEYPEHDYVSAPGWVVYLLNDEREYDGVLETFYSQDVDKLFEFCIKKLC